MTKKNDTLLIKTSWDEINLADFIKISELEYNKKFERLNLTRSIKMIAALSNKSEKEIFKFSQEMYAPLLEKIAFVFNDTPKDLSRKPFDVGGKKYMFVEDFGVLTAGEMISVEQLLMDAADNEKAFLPELLAILVRPAIEYKGETGKKKYKPEDFETDNLADRKALFMRELMVPYFVNRITAFMNGTETLGEITSPFSVRITQIRKKLLKSLDL